MSVLSAKGLSGGYGAMQVLRGIDLELGQGQVVVVLGPNGHGKTTLLRALSGLLERCSGEIRFLGTDLEAMPAHRRRLLGLAHVPQGDLLFAEMTVEENLLTGAYPRAAWSHRRARLDEMFALFPELAQRRGALARGLSGGERRMLAIARAMMLPSKLLMVDEPSIGLAPAAIKRVYEALASLKLSGIALLIVEESPVRVRDIADLIYVLDHGEVVDRILAQSLDSERLLRAFLG